ncbi:hypothetical protein BN133_4100 [Cronobacter dublinensis 582]|nr:hypothetical protein BN133_4100 [Cronobacter dublinensis 582]
MIFPCPEFFLIALTGTDAARARAHCPARFPTDFKESANLLAER